MRIDLITFHYRDFSKMVMTRPAASLDVSSLSMLMMKQELAQLQSIQGEVFKYVHFSNSLTFNHLLYHKCNLIIINVLYSFKSFKTLTNTLSDLTKFDNKYAIKKLSRPKYSYPMYFYFTLHGCMKPFSSILSKKITY